jgi:hypothetical protein
MLALICIFWLAAATLRPVPGSTQVGVVFPPQFTATDVLARISAAGGRLVREGAWPFIAVVTFDEPRTPARLESLGALFTVNPLILGSCVTRPPARASGTQIQGI